uniref:Beta-galactosidase n=1 Tax=Lygus hesperus TaxID=30085 RepID=A0A0A9WJC5_LYGHE
MGNRQRAGITHLSVSRVRTVVGRSTRVAKREKSEQVVILWNTADDVHNARSDRQTGLFHQIRPFSLMPNGFKQICDGRESNMAPRRMASSGGINQFLSKDL